MRKNASGVKRKGMDMCKRLLLLGMALMIAVGTAWATDIHLLTPTKVTKGQTPTEIDEWVDLYLNRMSDADTDYYLSSGSLGDTMCVQFQPLAPCSIYFAEQQWYTAGNFQSFVWTYSDEAAAAYPSGRAPLRGTSAVSPLGDVLFGPYNNATTGDGSWGEYLFTQEDLLNGEALWNENGDPFIVGWVKTQDDGMPQPLADNIGARGFTYTWFGGPWMDTYDETWGAYGSSSPVVDLAMRVGVSYPLGAPPIVGTMNQLPNTPNGNKTCTILCEITDDHGWSVNHSADLYVQINDGTPDVYEMLDPDEDNIFEASFTLDNVVDDQVSYWIVAEDEEGQINDTQDSQMFFFIVDLPNAANGADILVVDHSSNHAGLMRRAFTDMGWYTQWWDASVNKGIDEYVLSSADYNAVIVLGWGASTMPTRGYEDSGYRPYLEAGGNMFYEDQDYFYANGEDRYEIDFEAGDFAYDVFGIAAGNNDPDDTDTIFYGLTDDPISGDFDDPPFELTSMEDDNSWADGVTGVAEATSIFEGEDQGRVNGMSYQNDWGGLTVYLAFDIEYAYEGTGEDAAMTEQFETLMTNVVDYFGALDVEEGETAQPLTFGLDQNYPNPFNPTTQITFSLPHASDVSLVVYNVAGQKVATLLNGQISAGNKSINFDASHLSSGVYFYTLKADDFSATRKMMLMK
ncbi:MAG TPA: T9SS type A sorting domain-containing protein [Bacteroidetes bacterium]|nr:hypothetical protein BMS3Bbin04_02121 [bacterium BMS3Bbin04]HDO65436.1 T9SS type A sorting domain-containing protein [Bacteroidota bacterium]HEX04561.1 T9SS type A sorting domain-containing protein [Bacteroidota bacterium]